MMLDTFLRNLILRLIEYLTHWNGGLVLVVRVVAREFVAREQTVRSGERCWVKT